jgi:hypothetical protein
VLVAIATAPAALVESPYERVINEVHTVKNYDETDLVPTPRGIHDRVDQVEDFVDTLCVEKFSIMGNS